MPRASMACGLGLGFPALDSVPPLMVPAPLGLCGKGQCVTAQLEPFWTSPEHPGAPRSLIPISSADLWRHLLTHQAVRNGS